MSIYWKLDPMTDYRAQFVFKGMRKLVAKVNIPNMAYPNWHNDIKIPHDSRDHVIVPGSIKIMFNLDIESTDKTHKM